MQTQSEDGSDVWPEPDERMTNLIAGFDDQGRIKPMTYRVMREHTQTWPVTAATPSGPAALLKAARDMYALGFYSYELVASACVWSLFAMEAALQLRLASTASLKKLIELAEERKLIPEGSGGALSAGRKIRNHVIHRSVQPVWSLGMAEPVMCTSHAVVADLFPDPSA
jgi:hypothetical protein